MMELSIFNIRKIYRDKLSITQVNSYSIIFQFIYVYSQKNTKLYLNIIFNIECDQSDPQT